MYKNSYFSLSLPTTMSDLSKLCRCKVIIFVLTCIFLFTNKWDWGLGFFFFFNNYCSARSLSFSKVTDPFETLPQKNAHMHTHHIEGLHEPLKTSHGHPQSRDPGDFSGYKNYPGSLWKCTFSRPHLQGSRLKTSGEESERLLKMIIFEKTAFRILVFPVRNTISAFQNFPFSHSYE